MATYQSNPFDQFDTGEVENTQIGNEPTQNGKVNPFDRFDRAGEVPMAAIAQPEQEKSRFDSLLKVPVLPIGKVSQRILKEANESAVDLVDMTLGLPGFIMGAAGGFAADLLGMAAGEDKRTAAKAALEIEHRLADPSSGLLRKTVDYFSGGQKDPSAVAKGMQAVMELSDEGLEKIEELSGGAVTKEQGQLFRDQVMAIAPIAGVHPVKAAIAKYKKVSQQYRTVTKLQEATKAGAPPSATARAILHAAAKKGIDTSAVTPKQVETVVQEAAGLPKINRRVQTDTPFTGVEQRGAGWTQAKHIEYKASADVLREANKVLAATDPATVGHEGRVAATTSRLAKRLKLSEEQIVRADLGALGHDIAKRGMETILNKKTELTPAERAQLQQHPDLGARIMTDLGIPENIIQIVREHHANTGDFTSQVVKVADVGDSLIGGPKSGHDYPLHFVENNKPVVLPRTAANVIKVMDTMSTKGDINPEVYATYRKMFVEGDLPRVQKAQLEASGEVPWKAPKEGLVQKLTGTHFSQQPRPVLSGRMYGTGIRGAEAKRLAATKDSRIKQRINFYIDEGQGVFPEAGVGAARHDVPLDNLYDAATNPLKLPATDFNAFESSVVDAGFDGYYVRGAMGRQGAAVVLGDAAKEIKVPEKPVETIPISKTHQEALATTGFWGQAGAGSVIVSRQTGRILVPLRSHAVREPGTLGTWGGAIDPKETPLVAAKRELVEELGISPENLTLEPLSIYQNGTFKYHNFIALVNEEVLPKLNWETKRADWLNLDELQNRQNLHFGLKEILTNAESKKLLEKYTTKRAATLADFSPKNVDKILDKTDWAILTAENPGGKALTAKENTLRTAALRAELEERGIKYTEVKGKYGGMEENSVLLTGITPEHAAEIGTRFGQESILTKEGLHYADGTISPARAVNVLTDSTKDFYTYVPSTGARFAVDIDFNTRTLPEGAHVTPQVEASFQQQRMHPETVRPLGQQLKEQGGYIGEAELSFYKNQHIDSLQKIYKYSREAAIKDFDNGLRVNKEGKPELAGVDKISSEYFDKFVDVDYQIQRISQERKVSLEQAREDYLSGVRIDLSGKVTSIYYPSKSQRGFLGITKARPPMKFGIKELKPNADLRSSFLADKMLMGLDVRGADLRYSSFRRSTLRGANFDGANLENVSFAGADLTGASFINAKTKGADFTGAKFNTGMGHTEIFKKQAGTIDAKLLVATGLVLGGATLGAYLLPGEKTLGLIAGAAFGLGLANIPHATKAMSANWKQSLKVGATGAGYATVGALVDHDNPVEGILVGSALFGTRFLPKVKVHPEDDLIAARNGNIAAEKRLVAQVSRAMVEAIPDKMQREQLSVLAENPKFTGRTEAEQQVVSAWRGLAQSYRDIAVNENLKMGFIEGYVSHIIDRAGMPQTEVKRILSELVGIAPTVGGKAKFTKERIYPTFESLEKALEGTALKIRTKDIAEITQIYSEAMTRTIENQKLLNNLKEATLGDPEGRTARLLTTETQPGYVHLDNPQLRPYFVHPDIAPALKFVFDARNHGEMANGLIALNRATKRMNVVGSFFHAKSLLEAYALAGGNLFSAKGAIDGALKQFREGGLGDELDMGMRAGLRVDLPIEVSQQALSQVGQLADLYISKLVGKKVTAGETALGKIEKIQENTFDKFTWDYLHTGLKTATYMRLMEDYKLGTKGQGMDIKTYREGAASHVNDTFGGLDWYRLVTEAKTEAGRGLAMGVLNPSARDWLGIAIFAPDWTLSTLRAMSKALPGGAKNPANTQLARQYALRTAVLYGMVLTGLNYAFSGHFPWAEEQKDPTKLDLGDGTQMQVVKHSMEFAEWVRDPRKTFSNKMGIIPRTMEAIQTGKQYPGGPPVESRLGYVAQQVAPFSARAFQGEIDPQTSAARSLLGMFGVSIYGLTEEEKLRAREARKQRKFEKEEFYGQ